MPTGVQEHTYYACTRGDCPPELESLPIMSGTGVLGFGVSGYASLLTMSETPPSCIPLEYRGMPVCLRCPRPPHRVSPWSIGVCLYDSRCPRPPHGVWSVLLCQGGGWGGGVFVVSIRFPSIRFPSIRFPSLVFCCLVCPLSPSLIFPRHYSSLW